jgi:hypothetical protein
MSHPRPFTFDDIVARDRWLLTLTPTLQVASTEAEERLLVFLQCDENEQQYASEMSQWCEANDRWPEASAYHYAHLNAVARTQGLTSAAFRDSAVRFAKTMARSAGPLPADTFPSPTDLFTATIQQGSPPVRAAAVLTLVFLTAIHGAYLDELQLPGRVRVGVEEYLRIVIGKRVRELADRKGSHDLLKGAADALGTAGAELRTTIDDLVRAPSIHTTLERRERVLRATALMEPFSLPADAELSNSLKAALTTSLAQYVRELTEPAEQTFADALAAVRTVVNQCRVTSSHLAACFFIPLLVAVEDALQSHYQATLHSQFAILSLTLVKPEASRHGERTAFQLAIANEGTASTRNLTITLSGRNGSEIQLAEAHHSLGDLAPGREATIRSSVNTSEAEFTLDAVARWDDRSGPRSEVHMVKVSPQRPLDWSAIIDAGSPYRTDENVKRCHGEA